MCVYCERLTQTNKMDGYNRRNRVELPTSIATHQSWECIATILPPSPISQRRHQEDGLTSQLRVWVETDNRPTDIVIPIKYCPICGRDLSNDTE